jgi:hypothetical protein
MAKDNKSKPVSKTMETDLAPVPTAPASDKIQVVSGNVPIVTVQLLADINAKLGKILEFLQRHE